MTREEASEIIRKSELSAHADAIIAKLMPSVLIHTKRSLLDDIPLGASRMGGIPDVPEQFEWPRWIGSTYRGTFQQAEPRQENLDFIAQLNLEELQKFSTCKDLPPTGLLYFFYDAVNQPWGYDPEDHLGSRVIYTANGDIPLFRHAHLTRDLETHTCKVKFSEEWTIPDGEHYEFKHEELCEIIEEIRQDICYSETDCFMPAHRVFGWPEQVQGEIQLECQLVANGIYCGNGFEDRKVKSFKQGAADWRLLLQVDTDLENLGFMWGDMGRIYYWIHKNDLANRRFENVRLILQCS